MPRPEFDALAPLSRGVHAVRIDAEVVFLDVAADRYLCLREAAEAIRLDPHWRGLQVEDATLAQDLLAAGLILAPAAPGAALEPRPETPPRPTSSVLGDAFPRVRWTDAGPMVRATADVILHYRGRRFAEIVQIARRGRPSPPASAPPARLHETVQAFHRWIPYAPLSGKCLLRSFTLLRLLRRQGLDAQWVFGVATWPFRAHCWLQCGELALDERVDRLVAYTPILVV